MIFNRPLTSAEQADSVRNYYLFSGINGMSYLCVGETVMTLLAVRLGCSDPVVFVIGTMLYVGFVMLPLGRLVSSKLGAAKCDALFWALRNGFSLLVASAVFWYKYYPQKPWLVSATVLIGSFGFYGCRAAGIVMQQPLIGENTTESTRSNVIGRAGGIFWACGLVALIAISLTLHFFNGIAPLVVIISVGSLLGVWASYFLSQLNESSVLKESANKPIKSEIVDLLRDYDFRRLIVAAIAVNLITMLTIPACLATIKRGYGMTDFAALVYTVPQRFASSVASFVTGSLGRRYGPRSEILLGAAAMIVLAIVWAALASSGSNSYGQLAGCLLWTLLFFVGGMSYVISENGVTHYFLEITPSARRISASILLYTAQGVIAGLIGTALSAGLIAYFGRGGLTDTPSSAAICAYGHYFAAVAVISLMVFPLLLRLRAIRR